MEEKEQSGIRLISKDYQQMQGVLHYKIFKNGILIEEVEEKNLIVTAGRTQMAHLLAGDLTGKQIAKILFGTNGVAPTLADTKITNPYTKSISDFLYPASGQVQFNWSLGALEANGKAILEFGLICTDTTLFSRRVRESGKPINKESDISLEGNWTIIF
jgi:hypothetical protein